MSTAGPMRRRRWGCTNMKRIALALTFLCVCFGTALDARPAHAIWYHPGGVGFGMGYGLGGYGWGGGWGGGTAYGNAAQGMSQMIRAQGEYNKDTAESYIKYEDARTKYIDNQKKWTETFFAMREQNQAKQAEKFEKNRHSAETLTLAARSGVPRPLSTEAFDPVTGRITWPDALMASDYAALREDVEHQLELRTTTSGGGQYAMKLREDIEKMIALLKSQIQNLPTHDYITARKFLDSLAYAVRS